MMLKVLTSAVILTVAIAEPPVRDSYLPPYPSNHQGYDANAQSQSYPSNNLADTSRNSHGFQAAAGYNPQGYSTVNSAERRPHNEAQTFGGQQFQGYSRVEPKMNSYQQPSENTRNQQQPSSISKHPIQVAEAPSKVQQVYGAPPHPSPQYGPPVTPGSHTVTGNPELRVFPSQTSQTDINRRPQSSRQKPDTGYPKKPTQNYGPPPTSGYATVSQNPPSKYGPPRVASSNSLPRTSMKQPLQPPSNQYGASRIIPHSGTANTQISSPAYGPPSPSSVYSSPAVAPSNFQRQGSSQQPSASNTAHGLGQQNSRIPNQAYGPPPKLSYAQNPSHQYGLPVSNEIASSLNPFGATQAGYQRPQSGFSKAVQTSPHNSSSQYDSPAKNEIANSPQKSEVAQAGYPSRLPDPAQNHGPPPQNPSSQYGPPASNTNQSPQLGYPEPAQTYGPANQNPHSEYGPPQGEHSKGLGGGFQPLDFKTISGAPNGPQFGSRNQNLHSVPPQSYGPPVASLNIPNKNSYSMTINDNRPRQPAMNLQNSAQNHQNGPSNAYTPPGRNANANPNHPISPPYSSHNSQPSPGSNAPGNSYIPPGNATKSPHNAVESPSPAGNESPGYPKAPSNFYSAPTKPGDFPGYAQGNSQQNVPPNTYERSRGDSHLTNSFEGVPNSFSSASANQVQDYDYPQPTSSISPRSQQPGYSTISSDSYGPPSNSYGVPNPGNSYDTRSSKDTGYHSSQSDSYLPPQNPSQESSPTTSQVLNFEGNSPSHSPHSLNSNAFSGAPFLQAATVPHPLSSDLQSTMETGYSSHSSGNHGTTSPSPLLSERFFEPAASSRNEPKSSYLPPDGSTRGEFSSSDLNPPPIEGYQSSGNNGYPSSGSPSGITQVQDESGYRY